MEVIVSKSFRKWQESNKKKRGVLRAIDNFLYDVTKKSALGELLGNPKYLRDHVYEFKGNTRDNGVFRLYCDSDALISTPPVFKLALAGQKQKASDQHADINKAAEIVADASEIWELWEPKKAGTKYIHDDDVATENAAATVTDTEAAPIANTPVTTNATPSDTEPVVAPTKKTKKKTSTTTTTENATPANAPVADTGQPVTAATPALNGQPVGTQDVVTSAPAADTVPQFDAGDKTEYELAIIDYQINIEDSKIAIANYQISLEQAKIAKTMLQIKKLQLIQAQKEKQPQK